MSRFRQSAGHVMSNQPSSPFRFVVSFLGLCLGVQLASASAGAQTTMGAVEQLIGEAIPAPPRGFGTEAEVREAIRSGREKPVNVFATSSNVRVKQNVTYGQYGTRKVTLDLYQPASLDAPLPGLVLIHGGAWKGGRKEDYRFYGHLFASRGYVVASISYRLSDERKFPAAVEDAKCALRWMRANAESLHVDPDRIAVMGGSAGGHLALMAAYSSDDVELEGNGGHAGVSSRPQCVIALYPPTDLTTEFVTRNPIASAVAAGFLGRTYEQAPELYERASPLKHVTANAPPTLLLHGEIDSIVPVDQSTSLARKLDELGVPYVYDRLPGWPHAMDLAQSVNDRFVWLAERFLRKTLKTEAP